MYKRISASGQAEYLTVWLGCSLGDSMRMCVYVFTGLLLVSLTGQWFSVCELSLSFGLAKVVILSRTWVVVLGLGVILCEHVILSHPSLQKHRGLCAMFVRVF
jgi:hypothetical protein